MITNYKKKWILFGSIVLIILSLCTLLIFVFNFKMQKRYKFHLLNFDDGQYILVNKETSNYLNKDSSKEHLLEFDGMRYFFRSKFYKKVDDNYWYLTNLNIKLNNKTMGYILVPNQHLWNYFS